MPVEQFVLIVFGMLVALCAAQILSLCLNHKHVELHCEVDTDLTEPDELFTLSFRARNTGLWPLFYVSVSFALEEGLEVRESEAWKQANCTKNASLTMVRFKLSLLPRHTARGRVHLSASRRGQYILGKGYIETGDFCGFSSKVYSYDMPRKLVCTARRLPEEPAIKPAGGFLGEMSARRFILEDPSLILGYRSYTGAEPIKRISWTQTARTGQLMVRNPDFTVDADVVVLMDEEDCGKELTERCLSMLRTACDMLEAARIPYAVISNGDLSELPKGVGRRHNFEIQRRIGLSHFTRYRRFEDLAAQCAAGELIPRGWIVIVPQADASVRASVARLGAAANGQVCLLTGEEATNHA